MRWAAVIAAALSLPAWADDEDYARSQMGRFLGAKPESREVEIAEPPAPPEPLRIVVTATAGVSDVVVSPTSPVVGLAIGAVVWSSRRGSWWQLLVEPRLSMLMALPREHATADLLTRVGLNLFLDSRFSMQLRAGAGPIGRMTIFDTAFSVGLAGSGELAFAVRVLDDERLRFKVGGTVTGHHFFIVPAGPVSGISVVGGLSWESWL